MKTIKGAGSILGDDGKGRSPVQKSILRKNLKIMSKKHEVAEKMKHK